MNIFYKALKLKRLLIKIHLIRVNSVQEIFEQED